MQQEYAPGRHENSAGLVRCTRGRAIQLRGNFQQKGTRLQGRPVTIHDMNGRQTGVQVASLLFPPRDQEQQQENRPARKSSAAHIRAQLSPVQTSSRKERQTGGHYRNANNSQYSPRYYRCSSRPIHRRHEVRIINCERYGRPSRKLSKKGAFCRSLSNPAEPCRTFSEPCRTLSNYCE